jgi:predicted esterase
MRIAALALLLLTACGEDSRDPDTKDDTGDTSSEDTLPAPAGLAELSSGACPDLSASNTGTFLSSGQDRKVTVVLPELLGEEMSVVFFFHGLLGTHIEPTSYHADALNLQAEANANNAIYVLPESRIMTYFGQSFYMWQVMDEDELDLVLYDDLRTCLAQQLDVDLRRFAALGFSGGALFTTVLGRERGDTLATMVEMSGGSDIDFAVASEDPIAAYGAPANADLPVLLFSGGDEDGWPSGFQMVDFQDATDTLEAHLVEDGYYTWRCRHEMGHTITMPEWNLAKAWALGHSYGAPSSYMDGSISSYADWCTEFPLP